MQREASWVFFPSKMLACQIPAACFPSALHRELPLSFPPWISLSPCQKQLLDLDFPTTSFQGVKWTSAFCECSPTPNSQSQYYLCRCIRSDAFQVPRKKKDRYLWDLDLPIHWLNGATLSAVLDKFHRETAVKIMLLRAKCNGIEHYMKMSSSDNNYSVTMDAEDSFKYFLTLICTFAYRYSNKSKWC